MNIVYTIYQTITQNTKLYDRKIPVIEPPVISPLNEYIVKTQTKLHNNIQMTKNNTSECNNDTSSVSCNLSVCNTDSSYTSSTSYCSSIDD